MLESIRCAESENSCVYGLVSVVIAGGFWFHLSGCYVESINETHCIRGAGPINWPGYSAELRANYCLCGSGDEGDLCNDSQFAKAVLAQNFKKNGGERFYIQLNHTGSSSTKTRAATGTGEIQRKKFRANASERKSHFGIFTWIGVLMTFRIGQG